MMKRPIAIYYSLALSSEYEKVSSEDWERCNC